MMNLAPLRIALLFLLALLAGPVTAAQRCPVPPELWDKPRSGRALAANPALKPCLEQAALNPATRVVIRHGSRGEAPLQAEELQGWLAALALDPARVALANDLGAGDELVLEVGTPK
ncbi:MAG TPA: hypothetical protein VLC55_09100 [Burkholderiales bacterium]|nr:hypothetical protein [Burkholderiales bacterium]